MTIEGKIFFTSCILALCTCFLGISTTGQEKVQKFLKGSMVVYASVILGEVLYFIWR